MFEKSIKFYDYHEKLESILSHTMERLGLSQIIEGKENSDIYEAYLNAISEVVIITKLNLTTERYVKFVI